MPRVIQRITKIIVHCSDSEYGDAELINRWHLQRGFACIGYHYVILNGVRQSGKPYQLHIDGALEIGRSLTAIGAHCQGHNHDSVGICLIGKNSFTERQLCQTLPQLLQDLLCLPCMDGPDSIFGHRDFNSGKTCPNIATETLRRMVA